MQIQRLLLGVLSGCALAILVASPPPKQVPRAGPSAWALPKPPPAVIFVDAPTVIITPADDRTREWLEGRI